MKLIILDYITGKINIYSNIKKSNETEVIINKYNIDCIKYMIVQNKEFEIINH